MKLPALFRRTRSNQDKTPTPAAPAQPGAAKELTDQEMNQVQGGRKSGEDQKDFLK